MNMKRLSLTCATPTSIDEMTSLLESIAPWYMKRVKAPVGLTGLHVPLIICRLTVSEVARAKLDGVYGLVLANTVKSIVTSPLGVGIKAPGALQFRVLSRLRLRKS